MLWKETLFSVAVDPVSILLRKTNAEILKSEAAREMVHLCFHEALVVLRPEIAGSEKSQQLENEFWSFLKQSKVRKPATLALLSRVLKEAKRQNIKIPVLEITSVLVKAYEKSKF